MTPDLTARLREANADGDSRGHLHQLVRLTDLTELLDRCETAEALVSALAELVEAIRAAPFADDRGARLKAAEARLAELRGLA